VKSRDSSSSSSLTIAIEKHEKKAVGAILGVKIIDFGNFS